MTDNDVIKALECCHEMSDCGDCMFALHRTHDGTCVDMLHTNILDLINRLQADCENYKQVAENQQSITMDRGFEIKKLKEEIERLKNAYKQCAFERDAYIEIENTAIAEAKAEAYKEFAERLKEKLFEPVETWLESDIVRECDIDNLLKEMVGEDK